jgi:hypothetical protein
MDTSKLSSQVETNKGIIQRYFELNTDIKGQYFIAKGDYDHKVGGRKKSPNYDNVGYVI